MKMDYDSQFMLNVDDVSKRYPSKQQFALENAFFSVSPGEIIAVVGHNGAGKSTLFDIAGGLSKPSFGRVDLSVGSADIGWCPQREIVDWSLTVSQNIALGLELRDPRGRKLNRPTIEDVAQYLGLLDFLPRTAETLSGGELRRTQIARALVGNPNFMILDEPTTGLDPSGIDKVFNYLETRRRQGASALISTHETSRFSAHCTRVIALHKGRIIADMQTQNFLSSADEPTDDLWVAYLDIAKVHE